MTATTNAPMSVFVVVGTYRGEVFGVCLEGELARAASACRREEIRRRGWVQRYRGEAGS